jgi:hypothetical protein
MFGQGDRGRVSCVHDFRLSHLRFPRQRHSYDVPRTNPIWGAFRRFEQRDAVYADIVTIVEIRYAKHLSEAEKRFVICKELCHSLEAPDGTHMVSDEGIDELMATFSVYSAEGKTSVLPAFGLEMLAEVSALEILCPFPIRKQRIDGGAHLDCAAVAAEFGIPTHYAVLAFREHYMTGIARILEAYASAASGSSPIDHQGRGEAAN